jgi:hypothetical protein
MNTKQMLVRTVTIAAAGAIAFVEMVPAAAAPVLSSTAIVKSTAPDMLGQVRWRGGRRGYAGVGIGLGIIGAVAGIAAARAYDYGPGYGYGSGYYAPGYYGDGAYYGSPYYGRRYYGGYAYDPGPAIALGVIGGVAGAMASAPRYTPGVSVRGRCWISTDSDRGYGYYGACYR